MFTDASFQELLTCCTEASYATNPKFEMAKPRAASWLVSIVFSKILTTLPTGVSILTMIEPEIVSEESPNHFSKNSTRWERRSTKIPRVQNTWGFDKKTQGVYLVWTENSPVNHHCTNFK